MQKGRVVEPKPDPYAVLTLRQLPLFCFRPELFSRWPCEMQTIAVSWDIYQRLQINTRDAALALGFIGLVQVLPMIVFALPGGQAADRYDRRTIVRSTQLLFAICALTFLILTRTHAHVGYYYLVLGVAACGLRVHSAPAINSLFPTLVPREVLPNAMMWNSTIFPDVGP